MYMSPASYKSIINTIQAYQISHFFTEGYRPHFTVAISFKGKIAFFKTMCTAIALSLQDMFHS